MKKLMIGAVCEMMAAATFAEPSVKITKAYQKVPGSGVVDYSYMVSGFTTGQCYDLLIEVGAEGCAKTVVLTNLNVATGTATKSIDVKTLLGKAYPNVTLFAELKKVSAVQLWANGPFWAETNLGKSEVSSHSEYGALYKFDDAGAAVKSLLGEEWRVPSKDDFAKLVNSSYCKKTWDSNRKGYTFTGVTTGYTDKSIFLPAAGWSTGGARTYAGNGAVYWTSDVDGSDATKARDFYFYDSDACVSADPRSNCASVRAVR